MSNSDPAPPPPAAAAPEKPTEATHEPARTPDNASVSPLDPHDGGPISDSEISPSQRKRGGRQSADASEETKSRHMALYNKHKEDPQLSQNKLAQWYSEKFKTTMSQCSVSRVLRSQKELLKKQREANGEEVEEFKPRKRKSIKSEDSGGDDRKGHKRARTSSGGSGRDPMDPITFEQYSGVSAHSQPRHSSGFQAVNAPPNHSNQRLNSIQFSHYTSPTSSENASTPILHKPILPTPGVGHLSMSHHDQRPPNHHRASFPGRSLPPLTQTGDLSPGHRIPPMHSHPPPSPRTLHPGPLSSQYKSTLPNGSAYGRDDGGYDISNIPRRGSSRIEDMMEAMQNDISMVKRHEGMIENILHTQREDRAKLRQQEIQIEELKRENEMLRSGKTDKYYSELSDKIELYRRNVEKEQLMRAKLMDFFAKEEEVLKDLSQRRASLLQYGPHEVS